MKARWQYLLLNLWEEGLLSEPHFLRHVQSAPRWTARLVARSASLLIDPPQRYSQELWCFVKVFPITYSGSATSSCGVKSLSNPVTILEGDSSSGILVVLLSPSLEGPPPPRPAREKPSPDRCIRRIQSLQVYGLRNDLLFRNDL